MRWAVGGFSGQRPTGTDGGGFQYSPVIATIPTSNSIGLWRRLALIKKVDLVVYKLEVPKEVPEFYTKVMIAQTKQQPSA